MRTGPVVDPLLEDASGPPVSNFEGAARSQSPCASAVRDHATHVSPPILAGREHSLMDPHVSALRYHLARRLNNPSAANVPPRSSNMPTGPQLRAPRSIMAVDDGSSGLMPMRQPGSPPLVALSAAEPAQIEPHAVFHVSGLVKPHLAECLDPRQCRRPGDRGHASIPPRRHFDIGWRDRVVHEVLRV
jgi:hypothetical protein